MRKSKNLVRFGIPRGVLRAGLSHPNQAQKPQEAIENEKPRLNYALASLIKRECSPE
jgi:hypothetical protein